MEPPEQAERIIGDVCARVAIDSDRLGAELRMRFEPGAGSNELIDAERVAREIVVEAWGDIAGHCDQALADVREQYLVQAARVLEAQDDLHARGAESWIAGGVIYDHAFQLAWDLLDEQGFLNELDG